MGRRSITKAKEAAKKTGAKGLGEDKTGISDVYKENYDAGSESNGDRGNDWGIVGISRRGKEIGGARMVSINVRGTGESRKKGWIRSIIMGEQPDMTGLQETKSGLIDDFWIEDIWGGRGYGYSQLSVVENSGGIIVIWDSRVFTCKEAIGDERFITVRGSWKGQTRRCSLCVFMDHM
ncbi:hypothetical protein CTI12_AA437410 [Artemisia annua]|uniref:RNA-directed DNA polymerase, eukaryota, Reverse transcriptase zinc-binding domain protein n=1 Tax=Artemisia annua TaxID=35608 RepID=A0A2U1LZ48_ARTAN|nr:hypothetical protein CTI12_AA437410 [Artemisia annua]